MNDIDDYRCQTDDYGCEGVVEQWEVELHERV